MNSTLDLLRNTKRIQKLYDTMCHEISVNYGISRIEIDILLFLINNNPFDTAKDIVEYRFLAKSHVSGAVDDLIKKGYLLGRPDEKDRRKIHLVIQNNANEVVTQAKKMQNDFFDILYAGITVEEKKVLEQVNQRMEDNVKGALKNVI